MRCARSFVLASTLVALNNGLLSPPEGFRSRENLQELGVQNLLQAEAATSPAHPGASVWLGAQWFKQTLDHFKRGENVETFDQKYFVDDTHYDGSGPIILYINGEAPLYSAPGGSSFTGYMAQQMKAMIVALEHRFYGDSHPFSDMSTSSLRYLNSAQAPLPHPPPTTLHGHASLAAAQSDRPSPCLQALLDLRKFRLTYDQQLVRCHPPQKPHTTASGPSLGCMPTAVTLTRVPLLGTNAGPAARRHAPQVGGGRGLLCRLARRVVAPPLPPPLRCCACLLRPDRGE